MKSILSIIIPTYNNALFLKETLDSLLTQTYQEWECILIDDGSTDETISIAEKYVSKDPRFMSFIRPADRLKGANACRNIGIEKSKGDYIIFLDGDDLLTPDCLEERVQCIKENKDMDGVVFDTRVFEDIKTPLHILNKDPEASEDASEYLKLFLTYTIPWQITSPIWKKNVFEVYGGFDEGLQRFQDVDLHTNLLLQGVQIKRVHTANFLYRIDTGMTSKYTDPVFVTRAFRGIYNYLKKYLSDNVNTEIISYEKRLDYLKHMYFKALHTYLFMVSDKDLLKAYLRIGKKVGYINANKSSYYMLAYRIEKKQWHTIKGIGMHRLRKTLHKKLGL